MKKQMHYKHVLWVLVVVCTTVGCRKKLIREWRAEDHDLPVQSNSSKTSSTSIDDTQNLVEAAWRTKCVECHGLMGKGDGPSGLVMRASDLTREEWQRSVKDEDIAHVIRNGRNRMPSFRSLPVPVIDGLVIHIRSLQQK